MSERAEHFIVVGLGHGDEGKGATVDFLARRLGACTVVRFGGGPQAAHHVVDPDGTWHCFSQLGSGSLAARADTLLSRNMLIEPGNLQRELAALANKGVFDLPQRLAIDARAPVVTPLHKMIGQMLEVGRGQMRHGSVGMGVGQAVLDRRMGRSIVLADFLDPARLRRELQRHFDDKLARAESIRRAHPGRAMTDLYRHYRRTVDMAELNDSYAKFGQDFAASLVDQDRFLSDLLDQGKSIVFEGAQGALLDPAYGPSPHVTKTDCTKTPAQLLLDRAAGNRRPPNCRPPRAGSAARVIGVVRAYAHRHGAGPLLTEDCELGDKLPELHNRPSRWQGAFRVGWMDLPAIRYGMAINGSVDALMLTNLDRLSGLDEIRVCMTYDYRGKHREALGDLFDYQRHPHRGAVRISGYKVPRERPAAAPAQLNRLLGDCRPLEYRVFEGWKTDISSATRPEHLPTAARALLSFLRSDDGLGTPIAFASVGPTWRQKIELDGLCRS